MDVLVLGAGMMGRAIAYDLYKHSHFKRIVIADNDKNTIKNTKKFLEEKNISIEYAEIDVSKINGVKNLFEKINVAISALPYMYNFSLAKTAIETKTHFIDLGGNNEVVNKERSLFKNAKFNDVTVIPDSGLAPGLVSIITKDIVEFMDKVDSVKIRVGGLPVDPKPPLNYQIVFSLNGLINEYLEEAIVLDHGKILNKPSMTDLEAVIFPKPFAQMEAFVTSGGCSTLPYTYQNKIGYLDYKTIRYPGHCQNVKPLLDIGLGGDSPIRVGTQKIIPRDVLISLLSNILGDKGRDVVLLKVIGEGIKDSEHCKLEYTMIDYCDEQNGITAMMRTTGFPVAITAQFIADGIISQRGVYCPEEVIPSKAFFKELSKRGIDIKIEKKID